MTRTYITHFTLLPLITIFSAASRAWFVGTVVGHRYGWLKNASPEASAARWVPDLRAGWQYRPLVRTTADSIGQNTWLNDDQTIRMEPLKGPQIKLTKSIFSTCVFFRRGQRWWGHQRDTTVNKILNRSKNYFCKTQRYETPIKVFLYAIQLNTRLSSSFASLFPHFSPFLSLLNCLLAQAALNQLSAASSVVRFPDPLDDGRFSKSGGDPVYA